MRHKFEALVPHATSYIYDCMYPNGDRPVGGQSSSLGLATTVVGRISTLTFDAEVEYGKYINGDIWIKDAGNGITPIDRTPAQTVQTINTTDFIFNGAMINPSAGGNQGLHQSQCDSTGVPTGAQAAFWDLAENVVFPMTLSAGDALLIGVSREAGQTKNWRDSTAGKDPVMKGIEVYTIVDHVPTTTELRPSPVDRTQMRFDTAAINLNLLPSLDTTGMTLPNRTGYDGYDPADNAFKYFERGTERFWPLFFHDYQARQFHPMDHMEDYHEDISQFLSEAYLLLCSDAPAADKEQLVINLCQIGIDYYGVAIQQGTGDSSWWVPPIIFAGWMLNDATMRDCYETNSINKKGRDMLDFYYWEDREDQANTYTSAYIPAGQTWSGHKVFFRNEVDAKREHEGLRPDEWYTVLPLIQGDHEAWKDDNYRRDTDTYPQVGMVLACNLMGLRAKHAHDATYEMMVRWMVDADNTAEHAELNTHYLANGNDFNPNSAIATNSARSDFINDMWNAHAPSVTWPSEGGTVERTLS